MKRVMAFFIILLLTLSITACKSESSEPKVYKIGLFMYMSDSGWSPLFYSEFLTQLDRAETDSLKYEAAYSYEHDLDNQTKQINALVEQGVDVLIVGLCEPATTAAKVIETADAAGIPVVFFRYKLSEEDMNASDSICFVGCDPANAGTAQGEIIRDLPDHGDINGDGIVKYIMITGDAEIPEAKMRTESSIKALADAGVKVECLLQQSGYWETAQGQEICATALAQFGNDIEVVFCNNDGMALGASEAIMEAGRTVGENIYLVGIDALDECVEMVRNGAMTGTVLYDHVAQVEAVMEAAMRYLNGEPNEKYYWIDYAKVSLNSLANWY